jgi:hypothetical protein
MNEELLNELREFRSVVKSAYSNEDIYQISVRMQELAKIHTWPVLYEACDFVANEGKEETK